MTSELTESLLHPGLRELGCRRAFEAAVVGPGGWGGPSQWDQLVGSPAVRADKAQKGGREAELNHFPA